MSDRINFQPDNLQVTVSQISQKGAELEIIMQEIAHLMASWPKARQTDSGNSMLLRWYRERDRIHSILDEAGQGLQQLADQMRAMNMAVDSSQDELKSGHIPAKVLNHAQNDPAQVRIRILEEPLTAQNLLTIISALTELSTKYWLIAKGRFADLIEYTQTHNGRFAEEANIVVTRISYNSPMNMDWKVDLSAPSVAEALVTTIDGITQAPKRLKRKELENQAKAQEIQHAEQQAALEQQTALLDQEQRRLEIEKQRLEVLEKQLEVQKKGIEYALEIAGKVVDLLHPGADPATRAMEIQTLLPNLVQLQNGKGLELALPTSPKSNADALSGDDPLSGFGRAL